MRSINPMIEKINPTIPIPITSSPIPDEQREIIMAKSSIAIPNPIFFIVNPPLQIPICQPKYTRFSANSISLITKSGGFFGTQCRDFAFTAFSTQDKKYSQRLRSQTRHARRAAKKKAGSVTRSHSAQTGCGFGRFMLCFKARVKYRR